MATVTDAIRLTSAIEIQNPPFKLPKVGSTTIKVDQNVIGIGGPSQITADATGVDILTPDMTKTGFCRLQNLEEEGGTEVEVGIHDGTTFHRQGRMKAGEPYGPFRLDVEVGKTFRVKTASGTAEVHVIIAED